METRPPAPPPLPPGTGRTVPRGSGIKIGWILSGVMVVVLGVVVLVLSMGADEPSRPTLSISRPGFFEVHEVKASPAAFLPDGLPSAAGDAADDYRLAVAVYRAHAYDIADASRRRADIARGRHTPPLPVMNAMEKILAHVAAGAAKKEMHYTTPQQIAVRGADEQASQLVRLGDALAVLVEVYDAAGRYPEEEKVLRSLFALGWHMEKEHVRATMALQGMEVQGGAVGGLGNLYAKWEADKHAAALKALAEYGRELDKVYSEYKKNKLDVIWMLTPNPGDVFATVQKDQDRAWRVDALLVVGVIRYTHPDHSGDQKAARRLLKKYAEDPDPFVKAAAVASRDLTQEGFDLVGTEPGP